jgi:coenzyme F420-reducing hydrogenase delta subunit
VEGIRAGKLEYRDGAIWGNPYLRILRSQLEQYIVEKLGTECLSSSKNRIELRKIKEEMADLKKRLDDLQARKMEIEMTMNI